MSSIRPRRLAPLAAAALALLACATWAPSAPAQSGGVYVALGDSYTSGPLVPNQHGTPIDCGRSDRNYPSLVSEALRPAKFVDVSCGSAQTKHMTRPQTGLPAGGTNPPQFNGLRADATLVTVGIGGNDAGLVGVAEECAKLGVFAPTGTACRNRYAPGGNDMVAARIDQAKPKIAAVLQGIHQRSPGARVAIVGYPDVLPKNGGSCYPMVPLSPDDVRYIDELIVRINAMIAGQAALNDAEFIDTYRDSGGHDVCKLPPERWFEGLVPTEPAFPLHPNGKGLASMARSALAGLSRPRPVVGRPGAFPAPFVSRLNIAPRPLRIGAAGIVTYRLNRAARVTFSVRRMLPGRRSGRRCVPVTARNAGGRRCARYTRVFLSTAVSGRAGANRLVLNSRRLGRIAGLYRLSATLVAGGRRGPTHLTSFRIVARR